MIDYFLRPFRQDGLGALLGGTAIIFIGELLEKFGSVTFGYYGAIPGFLIKIGAICLCFGYSSQVLRAVYLNTEEMPDWRITSLDFVNLLENLWSVFISLIYGFIFSLTCYFLLVGASKAENNLLFFLTHLNKFGFLIFTSIFFPAAYFWQSISPDDWPDLLNPVFVFKIIVKSMPMYILLIPISYFIFILFLYWKIKIVIIGSFVAWFIKFYLLLLFSLMAGEIFRKKIFIERS